MLSISSENPPRVCEHEDGKEIKGSMGGAQTAYVTEAWLIISLSLPISQPFLSQQSSGLIHWTANTVFLDLCHSVTRNQNVQNRIIGLDTQLELPASVPRQNAF